MQTRVTGLLKTEYPIIQGGMAWVADYHLAAAVSNGGGLGMIGAANAPAEWVAEQIREVRKRTDRPFGVNIMLMSPHADEVARTVARERVPVVTTGAGNPEQYMTLWKEKDIRVIPVIASVAMAKRMEKCGADAVVAEGYESGGHVGESTTMTLVPQVCDAVNIPVIAAGGIADGRGIAAALMLGAEGVQMGTRFVVTKECHIHPAYKERILKAKDIDTKVTGRSTGHPVRALRNDMTKRYLELEQAGASMEELEYLTLGALRRAVTEGDVLNGSVMAGQIAGMIHEETDCRTLIRQLIDEGMAIKKKKVAFLYPGQGAQMPGMGLDFYEQNSAAAAVVDTAQSVLDFDVKSLCFAKNDLLNRTEYTQPCLVTCCLAMTAAILETGIAPNMTAGLSLGEYAAIATAGAMDIKTALLLVRKRGLLMQNATKDGFGGMAAVLGLEPDVLEALLKNTDAVTVANYNCPGQQVITGETQALLEMIPRLKENGAKVIPLKVSGPFHSPFMKPAGEKLEQELEQVRLSELQIPYVSNVSAQPITKTEQIRSLLSQGVYSPVKWEQSMRTMLAEGVEYFVEIGPGHTLSTLLKKINAEAKICTVSTMEDLVRMQDFLNETV